MNLKNQGTWRDPLSFRYLPFVEGQLIDGLTQAKKMLLTEVNSVQHNPMIDDDGKAFSNSANSSGSYIAVGIDQLILSIVHAFQLSSKRISHLLHLEKNFMAQSSSESGLMLIEYLVSEYVVELKRRANPTCLENPSVNNQFEDANSMSSQSALRLLEIIDITKELTALELFCDLWLYKIQKPSLSKKLDQLAKHWASLLPEKVNQLSLTQQLSLVKSLIEQELKEQ